MTRIRHSSDPLDLARVGQLHGPDGPADRTGEDHLSAPARRHPPLHHLREQEGTSCCGAAGLCVCVRCSVWADLTFSSKPSPSMPNFFITGSAVDFNRSTCDIDQSR